MRLPALLLGLLLATPAAAQMAEVSLDRGPASELYLRKRPTTPDAPVLAPELKKLLLAGRSEPVPVGPENLEECATAQPPISAGQRIVGRVDGGRAQIWLEPAEGKDRQLTANGRNHWQPRIAPDAASFVYLSSTAKADRGRPGDGDYLLAQRQLPDGEERVLAQFYGGAGSLGISPWSADGKRIVFVSREPE